MSANATGTPTTLGIPTLDTAVDAPNGDGINEMMAAIDTLIDARIAKALIDAQGDLIYGSAADTPARLAIGSSGQVLTVSGGVPVWSAGGSGITLIADQTLGSDAASIDFSSIAGTYKHLMLLGDLRSSSASVSVDTLLRFNGDTAANYDWMRLVWSSGGTTTQEGYAGTSGSLGFHLGDSARANRFAGVQIWIPDYVNTTREKSAIAEASAVNTAALATCNSGRAFWRSTAAVTQVTILPSTGNFRAGSRLSLYGVS